MTKDEFLKAIEDLLNEDRDLGDHDTPTDALAWFLAFHEAEEFRETNTVKDIARMFYYGITFPGTKDLNSIEEVLTEFCDSMYGETIEEFVAGDSEIEDDDAHLDVVPTSVWLLEQLGKFYPLNA